MKKVVIRKTVDGLNGARGYTIKCDNEYVAEIGASLAYTAKAEGVAMAKADRVKYGKYGKAYDLVTACYHAAEIARENGANTTPFITDTAARFGACVKDVEAAAEHARKTARALKAYEDGACEIAFSVRWVDVEYKVMRSEELTESEALANARHIDLARMNEKAKDKLKACRAVVSKHSAELYAEMDYQRSIRRGE